MLSQTSTPVPIRLVRQLTAGIIVVSSVLVATATFRAGIAFGQEQVVETSQSRIASIDVVPKAQLVEAPTAHDTQLTLKRPARGKDWGEIHANNGVDIANPCGTDITAAADGRVVAVEEGWNGGYGNAVLMRHAGGVETYYAHLQSIKVEAGDRVRVGSVIGAMGETGKATGCHLHFEVHGATNPFGK